MQKKRIVVLLSGGGETLQALIDYQNRSQYEIIGVVSNNKEAFGIKRAQQANIESKVVEFSSEHNRYSYDQKLIEIIDLWKPDYIVLAGFMRILSHEFVHHFHNMIINIHPSLLPNYKGLHTHKKVIEAEEIYHGTTIHFVNEELDGGAHILQAALKIDLKDTAFTLEQRVKKMEKKVYPIVINWLSMDRVSYNLQVYLDGSPLLSEGYYIEEQQLEQLSYV